MDEKQALTINRLKDFIIEHYAPQMIILYGSHARGDADEFSDIDMMVIMDHPDIDKTALKILADTDHIIHDKHIMLRSTADYFDQKDIPGTMLYSALSEGIFLHQKPDFDKNAIPIKDYEDRKMDVIRKEYLQPAGDFLKKANEALKGMQVYRCRDYLRFTIARGLKAVLVFRDVHPPRSIDLEMLFRMAHELLPEIEKLKPLIEELNKYFPEGNGPGEIKKCSESVIKASLVVDSITSLVFKHDSSVLTQQD